MANFPFHPGKWPFFYGWMILIFATLGIISSIPGQTIGISVFTDPLIKALKISRDELSLAYMLGTIGSSFLLPWAGRMYDIHGVRPVAFVASVGLGVILLVLSHIETLIFDLLNIQSSWPVIFIMFISFMILRFFGQGVLTMSSRNMMMQWFERRRGMATGFTNVFVSLTFASSPVFLYFLIERYSWDGAWLTMAAIIGMIFPLLVLIFFRNKPEDSGLLPDGAIIGEEQKKVNRFPVYRQFTIQETRKSLTFWILAMMLAMQGLYVTGFTFHVISIFDEAGLSEAAAVTVFQPMAVLAVVLTLVASNVSDYITLKYLFILKGLGACTAILGLIYLGEWPIAYYLIIAGNGIMMGLFSVLATVTWPRYFGRLHLGAINGQATMLIVFGSALGPVLFSTSLSMSGSYTEAGWICFFIYLLLTMAVLKADNPQRKLEPV